MEIKNLEPEDYLIAVVLFTEGFTDDPLHILAFPEYEERKRITRLIYEMMVYHIVPKMNLGLCGAYDNQLIGTLIFTNPENKSKWTDELKDVIDDVRKKANNKNFKLIGEFFNKTSEITIPFKTFYANELTVKKEFRKKGIGKRLLEYVEKKCFEEDDIYGVSLDTTKEENVKLYIKYGYQVHKEIDFYGLKSWKMFKKVKP